MTEPPSQETIDRWHHHFAVECNNRAWDLSNQATRTVIEDDEMLSAAHAAAFHWSKVGQAVHGARADVTLAHMHALLGHGPLALHYARRCLTFFESEPCEDWDLAFAHAEMAHAAAASGDAELHARHYAEATERGAAIQDAEDRAAFEAELARIPDTVSRTP